MITPKSWGYEYEICNIFETLKGDDSTVDYCGKRMLVRDQHRSSIHRHGNKDEVLLIGNEEGILYFETGQNPDEMNGMFMRFNDKIRVRPGTWHRFSALRDTYIYEFSTHHDEADTERKLPGGRIDDDHYRDLMTCFYKEENDNRILTPEAAGVIAAALHKENRVIGFCNGCFDLMHLGHATLFAQAKDRCDVLFVAVNTDEAIRKLKGPGRPFSDERGRIGMVASNRSVDYVVICQQDTCVDAVDAIKPNVYVTTTQYGDRGPEAKRAVANGGTVQVIDLVDGFSTTAIAKKILGKK